MSLKVVEWPGGRYRILPTDNTWANRKRARQLEAWFAMPFEPLDGDRLRALLGACLLLVIEPKPLPPATLLALAVEGYVHRSML